MSPGSRPATSLVTRSLQNPLYTSPLPSIFLLHSFCPFAARKDKFHPKPRVNNEWNTTNSRSTVARASMASMIIWRHLRTRRGQVAAEEQDNSMDVTWWQSTVVSSEDIKYIYMWWRWSVHFCVSYDDYDIDYETVLWCTMWFYQFNAQAVLIPWMLRSRDLSQ